MWRQFRNVTPFYPVEIHWYFEGTYAYAYTSKMINLYWTSIFHRLINSWFLVFCSVMKTDLLVRYRRNVSLLYSRKWILIFSSSWLQNMETMFSLVDKHQDVFHLIADGFFQLVANRVYCCLHLLSAAPDSSHHLILVWTESIQETRAPTFDLIFWLIFIYHRLKVLRTGCWGEYLMMRWIQ
jgi:hypothetical protein